MEIRTYKEADENDVIQLWQACGLTVPHNNPAKDIRRKMTVQPELFLVGVKQNQIIATVMAGYEGHRGWLNYLAVSPDMRQKGLARQLVSEVERRLRLMGCPKINLQVRGTNTEAIAFYQKIGFIEDNVISLGKRLEID